MVVNMKHIKIIFRKLSVKYIVILLSVAILPNCSNLNEMKITQSERKHYQNPEISPEYIASEGIDLMQKRDFVAASAKFNAALKLSPSNSKIHFLNGLSYHLSSSEGDESKRALAKQGYDLSLKFDKSNWLVRYYLGLLHLDAKEFNKAKEEFAEAIILNDNDPDLLYHMGFAAYYSQDVGLAKAVFHQLNKIEPDGTRGVEALAIVSAANNEPDNAKLYLSDLQSNDKVTDDRVKILFKRLNNWDTFHTKGLKGDSIKAKNIISPKAVITKPEYDPKSTSAELNPDDDPLDMIMLDAVFISTEEVISSSRGTNLLESLSVQFGDDRNNAFERTRTNDNNSNRSMSQTSLITIPAIKYSLNIANSFGNRNEILARPSLVAKSGSESTFFAGVEIEGGIVTTENSVEIEKEVGVSLQITPEVQDDGRISLEIVASRSFIKPVTSSSIEFDFAVEISKTEVSANVIVNEGDTLILSGLSEKEISSTRSGVPFLQDLPALQYVFSNESDYKIQKSILILITARKADYIYQKQKLDSEQNVLTTESKAMNELRARYLDWFKPYPNTASVFNFMQDNELYREFRTGDVKMESWQGSQKLSERLIEARKFLYY
jgi:Tfp pilus assembly protein PilF|tara:strand:- start:4029 stop:5849 length:1821 start_codon:yes stop_codon:yes gene_type:complete